LEGAGAYQRQEREGVHVLSRTPEVRLYTRAGCHLCAAAAELLTAFGQPFEAVDIDADPETCRRYDWLVPVVVVDRRWVLVSRIDRALLARIISCAQAA
jgi:glutaredoxin